MRETVNVAAIAGMTGACVSASAYVPQIGHMFRAHCAGGVSRMAFGAWIISSVLCLWQAVAIRSLTFELMNMFGLIAVTLILMCAIAYKNNPCPIHQEARHAAKLPS